MAYMTNLPLGEMNDGTILYKIFLEITIFKNEKENKK